MKETVLPIQGLTFRSVRRLRGEVSSTYMKTPVTVHIKPGCSDILLFEGDQTFVFHYEPDCCATATIEDIVGELSDLENTPLLVATEATKSGENKSEGYGTETWSFYKFRTLKGSVTVRWYGSSNGYYSETVTLSEAVLG